MPETPTIDLDAEAILFDGHWYTRDDLARRIKAMLDAGDFNVTRPSTALEQLTAVMASVRTVAFRATPDIVEALNRSAATHGKTVGNRIRELLLAGLGVSTAGMGAAPQDPAPSPAPAPAPPAIKPLSQPTTQKFATPAAGPVSAAPPLAGPGALRSAGVSQSQSSPVIPAVDPTTPSVVVEPALQEEGAIELTERKKGDEANPAAESRWFKS